MDSRNVGFDRFAAALEDMLDDYYKGCDNAVEEAVDKTTKQAKKYVKKYAKSAGFKIKKTGQRYISGFSSKVKKEGAETTGEVGNSKIPGLVHLLEKGHAKVGGGRTRAFPHMSPAFDDAKDEFMDNVKKGLNKI